MTPSTGKRRTVDDRVRVLVADDSIVARDMLVQILATDPLIEVVGTARDGAEAVEECARLRPDIVTMDIHMPRMDGIAAVERIMAYTPTPVLVVSSSVHGEGVGRAFDALSRGALEVIRKPEPRGWAELDEIARDITRRVRVLARVPVVTHVRGKRSGRLATQEAVPAHRARSIVAIGSSTGGPSALLTVLGGLPATFPAPVVVAQHIAHGFIPGLVAWLDPHCALTVREAAQGDVLEPGVAYLAPTGADLEVRGAAVRLREPAAQQLFVPSVDTLFRSVARSHGGRAVGVLLTGMGADGADGLLAMHVRGAATIAQDQATSTVFGMPRVAIELGAAGEVLPVDEIPAALERLVLV